MGKTNNAKILIVVDTGYAGIHHSKYWMPIHYDTIEDGQNKQSHLLFSFLVRIVLFLHFIGGIYLSKILLHHFIGGGMDCVFQCEEWSDLYLPTAAWD